jgi:diaminohydroxyphosphoribosylaminopyrimidine deaminase/5-amino-6-(5-phosphoribosylamino)uracil reductase
MVGAVLVYKDRIIGEGYHERYGGAHAEVNCLKSVTEHNQQFIKGSILYVSLEPCAHYGKTPPCANLIIKNKIPEVVVACRDPFEKVNGNGIGLLKEAGIKVTEAVLEKEAIELNRRFFTFHNKKRPYIILKWAQTYDRFIAGENYEALKISNEITNRWVHQLRSTEAAIMVGTNTALKDNPSLTTRLWKGKNPLRIILDKQLRIPRNAAVFSDNAPVLVLNYLDERIDGNIHFLKLDPNENILLALLNILYERAIISLIVEGGSILLQSFIDAGFWDEAIIITNTSLTIEHGIAAVTPPAGEFKERLDFISDEILVFKNTRQ